MTWQVVARRDLRILREDNTLVLFGALFAVLAAGAAYVATNGTSAPPLSGPLASLFLFAVPMTAGVVTHEAVPSAVASGRARLTLSLPHTRWAFLAGTGAARLATTAGSVVVALVAGVVVYVVRGGPLDPVGAVAVVALAALLAAAFVAATLLFTAKSSSTTLAAATTLGFFLLSLLWPVAVTLGRVVLRSELGVTVPDTVANVAVLCSPLFAYGNALGLAGVRSVASGPALPAWVGVLSLAAWTAFGFTAATRRFDRVDL